MLVAVDVDGGWPMAIPSFLFFAGALVTFCAAVTESNSEFTENRSEDPRPEKPTFAIIIFLISIYSWLLSLGMHFFGGFFNGLTPTKYYLTLGIAISATAYMKFRGNKIIREYFGPTPDLRKLEITSGQAAYIMIFLLGIGAYFAWLFV